MAAPATTRLITAEELATMPERDDGRYELIRGELRKVSEPPGVRHGSIATRLASALTQHVYPRRLGVVWVEGGVVTERGPDTVRGPDVAFLSASRVPPGGVRSFLEGSADIIAEVVSCRLTTARRS